MELEAIITEVVAGEGFYSFTPFADTYLLDKRGITEGRLILEDGRHISADQRRKVFALIGDITDWLVAPGKGKRTRAEYETLREMHLLYTIEHLDGYEDSEKVRRQLTTHYCEILDIAPFSLSNVDVTTARDFIDWLVELCVQHGIPCLDTLLNRCEDRSRYLYACVAHRRCAICGAKADIHHAHGRIGMGGNRRNICHIGSKIQPLCRRHHSEAHNIGQDDFDNKYHLTHIEVDEEMDLFIRGRKGKANGSN